MDDRLATLRKEYGAAELSRKSVDADPIRQFSLWFREAEEAQVPEPNAMTLSTASRTGRPSARVVLLKDVSPDGFTFFTNYLSRKARELAENPYASMVFWWRELERQVRVDGVVERLSGEESDEYFEVRPRGSQIGAWASPQSEVIDSRSELEERVRRIESQFDNHVPRPEFWGGYRLIPDVLEFWQGRESRLHDRILYRREDSVWCIERLAP